MKAKPTKTGAPAPASAPTISAVKRPQKEGKKVSPKPVEASGKLGKVVALLKRPKGTTIAQLMKATGWQAHSVRGAISGTIKKKLKLAVSSEKVGDVRTYRIRG
jgi:hypothetical protein